MAPKEYFLFLLENTWIEKRHLESQRATMTNILIFVSSALVSLIVQGNYSEASIPLCVLLFAFGMFGMIFTAKVKERYALYQRRLEFFYDELDNPSQNFKELREKCDSGHQMKYEKLAGFKLYWLWLMLHGFISLIGVVLLAYIVFL